MAWPGPSGVFDSQSSCPGAWPGQGEGDLGVVGLEQGPSSWPGKEGNVRTSHGEGR